MIRFKFLFVLLAATFALATQESSVAVTDYGIAVPTRVADGRWYVCQGYNNTSISHKGGDRYGLDMTRSQAAVGPSGCNYTTSADHRRVYTPVDGFIAWKADGTNGTQKLGLVCINLRSGSTSLNMSIKVGHMKTTAATSTYPAEWRSVPVGGRVHQGSVLGYVAAANQVINGGVGHIHISVYTGKGCVGSNAIPFSSAKGMALVGLSCSTGYLKTFDLPSNGTTNQYSGLCMMGALGGPG